MTGLVSSSRYSSDDFETASVRSAAPSYVSDAPSYHSTVIYPEAAPPYTPAAPRSAVSPTASNTHTTQIFGPPTQRSAPGLPPVPSGPPPLGVNISNFRLATWPTANASATRQYHRVAERRVNQPLEQLARRRVLISLDEPEDQTNNAGENSVSSVNSVSRPLEDPRLVGEQAAAEARRERLAREARDDVLLREDRQWDLVLAQMKDWEERERNWNRFRRDLDQGRGKRLFRRIGGRLL